MISGVGRGERLWLQRAVCVAGNDARDVGVGVRVHLLLMDIAASRLSSCPPGSAPSRQLGQVRSLLGRKGD